jgi:hypothetical protein
MIEIVSSTGANHPGQVVVADQEGAGVIADRVQIQHCAPAVQLGEDRLVIGLDQRAPQEWPGGRVRGHGLPIGRPPGCLQRRTDDPAMRPAAAQIAVQSLPHLLLSRDATVAQQANRGHHHAGGAIAALGGLLIDEGLLDRMGPAAARQPHHGDDRAVHGRHRQVTGRAGAVADEH